MPQLVYATDIAELPTNAKCPPADAVDEARECYRFVHDPLDARSFIPAGKMSPRRMSNVSQTLACSMLALSLYSTDSQAREKYCFIIKHAPMAKKSLGTHLAKGAIELGDGQSTPVDKKGHFDFHPFAGTDISSRFETVGEL